MRVLALYNDDNGDGQQAVVTLTLGGNPYELGVNDSAFRPDAIASELPNYNDGGGLFIVELPEVGERPDVVDQNGNEVSCEFIEVDLG